MVFLAAGAPRETARPPQTELAVLDAEIDVVLHEARKIGPEDDALGPFVDIHRRRPGAARRDLVLLPARAREGLLEEAVHPLLERQKVAERIEVARRHGFPLERASRGAPPDSPQVGRPRCSAPDENRPKRPLLRYCGARPGAPENETVLAGPPRGRIRTRPRG